ncbi:MAG: 3'-5' exonuclease [Verrucomicrobia bacterium]|nr:3'-5' exonuclease [Verrucomicrobiota bacterium]
MALLITFAVFAETLAALTTKVGDDNLPFPNRKISNVTFVAFDTETTGLSAKNESIVELAVVKYRNGEIVEKKNWLMNPGRPIPYWARRVHGISNEMVKDKPSFAEIYPEFLEFIKGSVLIAHNAHFDISFLNEEIERAGLKQPANAVIDSLGLFRNWYPELKSHKLAAIATHVSVNDGGFHRALADSVYVALILDDGLKHRKNDTLLKDLYADSGGPMKF